ILWTSFPRVLCDTFCCKFKSKRGHKWRHWRRQSRDYNQKQVILLRQVNMNKTPAKMEQE
uniref:Uncharacterized protein n=1 Tax=Oreochromis aureus TaxID=47969 RepID=A0AAZ1XLA1_OREAU